MTGSAPSTSGVELAASAVQAAYDSLIRSDATPPIGGWYSTAIRQVAVDLDCNPYSLDRDVRELVNV